MPTSRVRSLLVLGGITAVAAVAAIVAWPDAPADNRPQVDYLAKLDSTLYAVDPNRNAWPLIQEVETLIPADSWPDGSTPDSDPETWETFVLNHSEAIGLLRRAAHRERLGIPADVAEYYVRQAEFHDSRGELESASTYWAKAAAVGPADRLIYSGRSVSVLAWRAYANMLVVSARLEAGRGHAGLAADDFVAIILLGELLWGRPLAIDPFIGLVVQSAGYESMASWLRADCSTIPVATLKRLETWASVKASLPLTRRAGDDERYSEGVLEAAFDREGSLSVEGVRLLRYQPTFSGSGVEGLSQGILDEWSASRHADREETARLLRELRLSALAESGDPAGAARTDRIEQSLDPSRHAFVIGMNPVRCLRNFRDAGQNLSRLHDGIRAWIATCLFWHAMGRWPNEAEELVPEFLDCVPESKNPRQPLRFVPSADGAPPRWGRADGTW